MTTRIETTPTDTGGKLLATAMISDEEFAVKKKLLE